MAYPSITYLFTNGTAADATQVNTNFQDVINGLSDGTKDLSVATVTTSGAATLGNASNDDITINGSLASSIPVKTNNSFDIGGSSTGLASVYLGAAGGFTTRLLTGATASHTITLPPTAGSDGYVLRNTGSATTYWHVANKIGGAYNYSLTASVAASALTIALKGVDGSDPSSTNKVSLEFRNSTLTTGTPSFGSATAATSVVISSGSTLGHGSGKYEFIYVYAINNAGTIELAVSTSRYLDEYGVISTTAEGGAGAADSRTGIYSTTARSNVAVRLLGVLVSNQATAGTWASSMTSINYASALEALPYYEYFYHTGAGLGGTATKIPYFTTVAKAAVNNASGLFANYAPTIGNDSTNGFTFTANGEGLWSFSFVGNWSGGQEMGISLNASSGATNLNSLTAGEVLVATRASLSAGECGNSTCVVRLIPGDVIRPHTNGSGFQNNSPFANFRAVFLSL